MISYNLKNILSTVLVAIGFIYFANTELTWYSLLVGYLLSNCVLILVHEGWVHNYIEPKNRLIGFILDYLGYIIFNTSKLRWQYLHNHHHKYWKTEEDWDQFGVDHTPWPLYLFFLYRQTPPNNMIQRFDGMEAYARQQRNKLFPESKFLEDYFQIVVIISHLIFLFAFGLEIYFYFLFFQVWIFIRLFKLFNEIIPHAHKKTIGEEKDASYLFLLCTNAALHTSHHIYKGTIFFGKGWWKYLNVQYYFVKTFYNIKVIVK